MKKKKEKKTFCLARGKLSRKVEWGRVYCFSKDKQVKKVSIQGPVSRKSRNLFVPEKQFVKLRLAYSVKLVFSYVVKGIKI